MVVARPGRRVVCALAVLAVALLLGAPAATAAENPISLENARQGDRLWTFYTAQGSAVDGYTGETSVAPGETLNLHVSASVRYRVEVYRLGWYGGAGARLVACVPSCSGDRAPVSQPVPPAPDPETGKVDAGWSVTDTLTVSDDWVSGYYVARFVVAEGPDTGKSREYVFVVRPAITRASKIVAIVPVNTSAAYNSWGGKSLYTGIPATHVSFNRPRESSGQFMNYEMPMLRFMERLGYDVSYVTDVDLYRDPSLLLGRELVMTFGHGEYWTMRQRDRLDAARDAGGDLAFMGSDTGSWQVRYEDAERTLVGYKLNPDPVEDRQLQTIHFRDLPAPRPECRLLGVQRVAGKFSGDRADYTVTADGAASPWANGAGLAAGDRVRDVVGHEWDLVIPGCEVPAPTVLLHWEGHPTNADAVTYLAPSGARVFSSGTLSYAWALDDYDGGSLPPDPRIQRFTANMLDDLAPGSRPPGPTTHPPSAPPRPSISVTDVSTLEGDAGSRDADFAVELSRPADAPVSVTFKTADTTARAALGDYGALALTKLTFAPGETEKHVRVPVNGDATKEGNEAFALKLSSPKNAVLGDSSATATIVDEEGPLYAAVSDVPVSESPFGSAATFEVRLSDAPAPGQAVSVGYATANGTATGGDYAARTGTLTFDSATGPTQAVSVPIHDDVLAEPNESFSLKLSKPTGLAISDSAATATIAGNDGGAATNPKPGIEISDQWGLEEDAGGATRLNFTVSLSHANSQAVTLKYATANSTAVAGSDYTARPSATMRFEPGETSKTVEVAVAGDDVSEGNETFWVKLSSPAGATLSDSSAVGTIADDEGPIYVYLGDTADLEGSSVSSTAKFWVALSSVPAPGQTVGVSFATTQGSATSPSDFAATAGTLTLDSAAGQAQTVTVPITADLIPELEEQLLLSLSAPKGAVIADATGVGTLMNDD